MTVVNRPDAAKDLISDQEALTRIRGGDSASFEWIMRRHNRRLYRIARGILRNEADAEDAVQDAYVKAFENLDGYEGKGPFPAWLAKIAVNEALGRLRRASSAGKGIPLDDPNRGEEANFMAELTCSSPNPEQSAALGEFRQVMEAAISALPDVYRPVFILRGLEEMSVAETADCLDLESATVKTRYHRARKILQKQLADLVLSTAGEAFPFAGERCDRIVAEVFRRLEIRNRP